MTKLTKIKIQDYLQSLRNFGIYSRPKNSPTQAADGPPQSTLEWLAFLCDELQKYDYIELDCNKSAAELKRDRSLSVNHWYKLLDQACLWCIDSMWNQFCASAKFEPMYSIKNNALEWHPSGAWSSDDKLYRDYINYHDSFVMEDGPEFKMNSTQPEPTYPLSNGSLFRTEDMREQEVVTAIQFMHDALHCDLTTAHNGVPASSREILLQKLSEFVTSVKVLVDDYKNQKCINDIEEPHTSALLNMSLGKLPDRHTTDAKDKIQGLSEQCGKLYVELPPQLQCMAKVVLGMVINGINIDHLVKEWIGMFPVPLYLSKPADKGNYTPWDTNALQHKYENLLALADLLINKIQIERYKSGSKKEGVLQTKFDVEANILRYVGCCVKCLVLEEVYFCKVCYRARVNKYYCREHTLITTETQELRWAKTIEPRFNELIDWYNKKAKIKHNALLENTYLYLEDIQKNDLPSAFTPESYLAYLSFKCQNSDYDISSEMQNIRQNHASAANDLDRVFAQLTQISTVVNEECHEFLMMLFAVVSCQISHHLHYYRRLNLYIFFRAWYSGIRSLYCFDKKPNEQMTVNPRLAPLLDTKEFEWLTIGFDKFTHVVSSSLNYSLLMEALIRQSAWLEANHVLKNDPQVGKLDAQRIVELHYKHHLDFSHISKRLSTEKPILESTIKTTMYRHLAKQIDKDMWLAAKQQTAQVTGTLGMDAQFSDESMPLKFKKQLAFELAKQLGYEGQTVYSYVVTLLINKFKRKI